MPDSSRAGWLARPALAALCLCFLLILIPNGGQTISLLLIPVHYHRVELKDNEPYLLELVVAPGEWQVAPASLGYFTSDPSSGLRRFVFSAEVPRGLLYRWLPPDGDEPNKLGHAEVIEISAPANRPLYFETQLEQIRLRVVELNRERNLLLQSRQQLAPSRSSFSSTLDALWPGLEVGPDGIKDGGWMQRVLTRYSAELPQLTAQLQRDAAARGTQKQLYYSGQQARLRLLLSQFDLQHGLARLPRPRSEELLSMGNTRLVQQTVLEEIDRLQVAWESRQSELVSGLEAARGIVQRRQWQAMLPTAASPLTPLNPAASTTAAGPGLPAGRSAEQELELAVLMAWIEVQQQELEALQRSLPQLQEARAYVSGRSAPDWSNLPRLSISSSQLKELTLEQLRYYAAFEGGITEADSVALLCGLARQFETAEQQSNITELSEASTAADRLRSTIDGLASGRINASPDELAYGVLLAERSRGREQRGTALSLAGDSQLAQRASLSGQLDLVLRDPGSRGLAAYDLVYLRFIRWYCALGLPPEAPAVATVEEPLATASFGFEATR